MSDVELFIGIGCLVVGILMMYVGMNKEFW